MITTRARKLSHLFENVIFTALPGNNVRVLGRVVDVNDILW
jgi:hypothetical protein